MPLVRMDLRRGKSSAYLATLRECVHRAMRDTFDVQGDDRFMLVRQYDADEFDIDATYGGMNRSPDVIIVQITCNTTRGIHQKHALYQRMVELVEQELGLRGDDLFINLVESPRLNWSFGRGMP